MQKTRALNIRDSIFYFSLTLLLGLITTSTAQENLTDAIESKEVDIRLEIIKAVESAKLVGLESLVEVEADKLTQRLHASASRPDADRFEDLTQLARDANSLARTVYFRPQQPDWGPRQATGAPNTTTDGENATSWTPSTEDAGIEWLKLTYDRRVDVARVRVHQNFNPGVVTRITAKTENGETQIWATDSETNAATKWLEVTPETESQTDTITIHLDTRLKKGWNEIDAVELVGKDGSKQWAAKAESSTVYNSFGRGPRLSLRGKLVTDEWLAACAPRIADAEQIALYNTSITDAGLAHLHGHEHLVSLVMHSPGITGSGLKGFGGPKLRDLNFIDSGVNDEGLASLSTFEQLHSVSLDRTNVTGAALRHLAGNKNLKSLSLGGTAITNDDLSHLPALPSLENLNLRSTKVTSLEHLKELKSLKSINLTDTQVDDAGLKRLGEFPEAVESLRLMNTQITGAGLRHLAGMKSLTYLDLQGTAVTDEGLSH
ncbi:MAG: hypothetical protein AAF394_18940, partial [Planctomycetota bacterium]